MQKRLGVFDYLRVLATLAVIGIHVSADYAATSSGGLLINQVVRFAVPMFIIISGYLLYYQGLSSSGRETLTGFYRKRFTRVLCPYILWTVFYTLLNQYLLKMWPGPLIILVAAKNHLLWGTAAYHLYFMVIIIQCYLLYPVLRGLLQKNPHTVMITLLASGFLCQICLYLNTIGKYSLPKIAYPQLYLVAFPIWLGYFGLGMFLAHFRVRIESYPSMPLWGWGLAWGISLAFLLGDGYITGSFASSGKPTVMIYALLSFLFFYEYFSRRTNAIRPCLSWISTQSFLIYLSHPVVLLFLQRIVNRLGIPGIWEGTVGMLALYLLTVSLTMGLVYLVRGFPGLWLLGGRADPR